MGLADNSRADGALKRGGPDGTYWTLKQLADKMGMAKGPAIDTLVWLKQEGWLAVRKGKPTAEGLGVDERRLIRPTVHSSIPLVNQPTVHGSNTEANQGENDPRSTNRAATVHKPPSHGSHVDLDGELHPGEPGTPGSNTYKEAVFRYAVTADGSVDESPEQVNNNQRAAAIKNQPLPSLTVVKPLSVERVPSNGSVDVRPTPLPGLPKARRFAVGDRVFNEVFGAGIVERVHPDEVVVLFDRRLCGIRRIVPERLTHISAA
jgi:hypothetical protein